MLVSAVVCLIIVSLVVPSPGVFRICPLSPPSFTSRGSESVTFISESFDAENNRPKCGGNQIENARTGDRGGTRTSMKRFGGIFH